MLILITTYPFTTTSAGIVSQHKLCDTLRKLNYDARLVMIKGKPKTNPKWDTPVWDGNGARGVSVGIYSELINENPLNTTFCVYWILGLEIAIPLHQFRKRVQLFWHSDGPDTLKINILDEDFFSKSEESARSGLIAYRGKRHQWTIASDHYESITYIDRFGKNAVSRQKLKELLQRSRALIVEEDTLLIEESILSGCPVIVRPGVELPAIASQIPSIYFQKNESDWPNLDHLYSVIQSSIELIRFENKSRDSSVENLCLILESMSSENANYCTPRTFLPYISKIRIFQVRVRSAFIQERFKGLLGLTSDAIKSRMSQ